MLRPYGMSGLINRQVSRQPAQQRQHPPQERRRAGRAADEHDDAAKENPDQRLQPKPSGPDAGVREADLGEGAEAADEDEDECDAMSDDGQLAADAGLHSGAGGQQQSAEGREQQHDAEDVDQLVSGKAHQGTSSENWMGGFYPGGARNSTVLGTGSADRGPGAVRPS